MRRCLVISGILLTGGLSAAWWYTAPPTVSPHPVLDCPEVLDVGEQDIYGQVAGRFTVRNRGGAVLVLNDIRTACACTGFEQERKDRFVRVDEVRLAPGQSTDLMIRHGVHGPVGVTIDTPIFFRTNDPVAPERVIRLLVPRVTGGVEAFPRSIVCGSLLTGQTGRHLVDVTDEAPASRQIERVVSSNPERVQVRVLPPEPQVAPEVRGKPVARLEVTVHGQEGGPIEERVEVHLAGRPFPTVIPVSALPS